MASINPSATGVPEIESQQSSHHNQSGLLRVAVVGCGYWGQKLLRNFFESPLSTVTRACDLDPRRLPPLTQRYPTVRLDLDAEAVWRDAEVDAVCIATNAASHYGLARQALEAGKHVWLEKPMCLSYREAQELEALAARLDRVLLVDHTYVYAPAVQRLQDQLQAGELGNPLYYSSSRVNLDSYYPDVNVIWDLATHDFAIIDYLFANRPQVVSATAGARIDGVRESVAYLTVECEQDLLAHIEVSWLGPVKRRQITIAGTNGMMVFDDTLAAEKLRLYDRSVQMSDESGLQVEYSMGQIATPYLSPQEPLQIAAQHFAECIATHGRPLTDAASGVRVVAMLAAAQRSLANGSRLERIDY